PPVLKRCELYFAQAIIWIKEHPVLTRKDFMGNHEWCFYGWKEGAAHRFFGPANVPDTWSIKKVNPQSMVHLTEKPVELARRAIEFAIQAATPDDIVVIAGKGHETEQILPDGQGGVVRHHFDDREVAREAIAALRVKRAVGVGAGAGAQKKESRVEDAARSAT
ncbi:MAG: hypothetical protein ACK58T_00170, partial [Phycisphaerae bacterium]